MKKNVLLYLLNLFVFCGIAQNAIADRSHITVLKEMFDKVVVEKNDRAIPLYYDKDFELYSNGKKMNFDTFLKMHHDIYKTSIQYKIRYDEKTFIEQGNRIAGRLFITTKKSKDLAREIEVILIAEYKDSKLYRLWELTYPDWSKMKAFEKSSN
jgi:hypothetical protein